MSPPSGKQSLTLPSPLRGAAPRVRCPDADAHTHTPCTRAGTSTPARSGQQAAHGGLLKPSSREIRHRRGRPKPHSVSGAARLPNRARCICSRFETVAACLLLLAAIPSLDCGEQDVADDRSVLSCVLLLFLTPPPPPPRPITTFPVRGAAGMRKGDHGNRRPPVGVWLPSARRSGPCPTTLGGLGEALPLRRGAGSGSGSMVVLLGCCCVV